MAARTLRSPDSRRLVLGPALLMPVAFVALFLVLATSEIERQMSFWRPPTHAASWPGLTWLAYPGGSEVLYLRRDVVRTSTSGTILAKVAATEAYELYVNGQQLGAGQFEGAYVRGVFDLSARLTKGHNVIALRVVSSAVDVFAQGAVELECKGPACLPGSMSLGPWRALDHERLRTTAHPAWSSVDYDDQSWPPAMPGASQALPAVAEPLPLHALVGLHGSWIWSDDLAAPQVAFRRELEISDPWISGAWLGVATSGDYRVGINGHVFAYQSGSRRGLGLFEIAPYLQRGRNEILVWAAVNDAPRGVAITGLVHGEAGPSSFSSDAQWRLVGDDRAAIELGRVADAPPALVAAPLPSPPGFELGRWWSRLGWGALGLVVLGGASAVFVRACRRRGTDPAPAMLLFCAPFALGDLLLFDLAMLRSDPSLPVGPGTAGAFLVAAALLLALWWRASLAPREAGEGAGREAEVRP